MQDLLYELHSCPCSYMHSLRRMMDSYGGFLSKRVVVEISGVKSDPKYTQMTCMTLAFPDVEC